MNNVYIRTSHTIWNCGLKLQLWFKHFAKKRTGSLPNIGGNVSWFNETKFEFWYDYLVSICSFLCEKGHARATDVSSATSMEFQSTEPAVVVCGLREETGYAGV